MGGSLVSIKVVWWVRICGGVLFEKLILDDLSCDVMKLLIVVRFLLLLIEGMLGWIGGMNV